MGRTGSSEEIEQKNEKRISKNKLFRNNEKKFAEACYILAQTNNSTWEAISETISEKKE